MSDRVKRPWQIHRPDPAAALRLSRALGVSALVGQLLVNRALTDPAAAARWLDVPAADLPAAGAVPGAVEGGEILARAAHAGAKVCVYGDYDVDGTTGASTLYRVLSALGARAHVYIPHRLEEGYGLNAGAVRRIAAAGFSHLVTVDCGIASPDEIRLARDLGMTAVVTDHHQPKAVLPDAAALVHPALPGRVGAAPNLCGSAVAWTLGRCVVRAFLRGDPAPDHLKEILGDGLARAAVGTVADVVPLVGENRAVVRHGLARLGRTADTGLAALLEACGLKDKAILAEDIGFKVGPRINAAGRLGAAGRVIDLLGTSQHPDEAARLAGYLDYCNQTRQRTERAILSAARDQGAEQVRDGRAAVVVAHDDWHPGVIGIVASRLVERFGRPALVVSFGTLSGVGYGSGRSIPGLGLHTALDECMPHLVAGGGHAMAAGFKVRPEKLAAFREAFWAYCAAHYGGPPPPPPLVVEAEAEVAQLTIETVRDLARLEPHGAANPRPYFLLRNCRVERSKLIGERQDHLSLTVSHPGPKSNQIRCVGFGMGERIDETRGFLDVVGVPKINEWMGRKSVEMELKDFRAARR